MSTRGRSAGRTAVRRRAAGSLFVLLLVSGAAVGSANGLAMVSSPDTTSPTPIPDETTETPDETTDEHVAPVVSLSRWEAAVALGSQAGTARPVRADSPVPTTVPPLALGAYHRASAVLADAAPACELDWSLLAAVGHVESAHGERAGASLDADGVAQPAIIGPVIDAPIGRGPLADTDGGELDGRPGQDRAVGPMQLLPSVWAVAAVDGDGDGRRDPQDIDDAALAAGVLLCTSAPDVSSAAGRRAALRHYNATPRYVDLVQRLAAAYALAAAVPPAASPTVTVPPTAVPTAVVPTALVPTAVQVTMRRPLSEPPRDAGGDELISPETVTPTAASTAAAASAPDPSGTATVMARAEADPTVHDQRPPSSGATATSTTTAQATSSSPAPTGTTDETATEPSADPPAGSTASPADEPTATGTPDPAVQPTPSDPPASEVVVLIGVWTMTDAGQFQLDETLVDVEGLGDLSAPAPEDLDGNGAAETVGEELAGLVDRKVELVATATQPGTVALGSIEDLRRLPE